MVLTPLLLAAALAPAADVQPKIVSASLFKNGYAVVVRELDVRGTETTVTEIPQSSLGTFWIWTSDGLKIEELINTTVETSNEEVLNSMDEILFANVGKELTFLIRNDQGKTDEIRAKLLAATGSVVVLQSDITRVVHKGAIVSIQAANGELIFKRTNKGVQRVLKFKTRGTGKVSMVGLERGMTWAPGYALDISNEKELTLVAKSTVLNDLADVNGIEARFVTGFPNVPWAQFIEPLLSGQSIDQFTNFLGMIGQADAAKQMRGREMMTQNAAPAVAGDFGGGFDTSPLQGIQSEDLFFYRQANVTLKKMDRAMYVLFSAKSSYEHLYTLDLPDTVLENVRYMPQPEGPLDVWHGIKFKNTSGQPLTTAALTIFKDSEIMGQDTLMYTPASAEALVKMNKALDVRAEQTEEEVSRERQSLRLPNNVAYDLVTLKGTIVVRNTKPDAITLKVTRDLTGELISTTGEPKVTTTAKGLRQMNPVQRLVWTSTIAGGKETQLTYNYKLLVRSDGY